EILSRNRRLPVPSITSFALSPCSGRGAAMAKDVIGVGLIGYGFAGKTFHAPLIRAVEGLDLKAIASSDAAKVKKDFPGMTVFADPAEMFARSEIDLVVI